MADEIKKPLVYENGILVEDQSSKTKRKVKLSDFGKTIWDVVPDYKDKKEITNSNDDNQ